MFHNFTTPDTIRPILNSKYRFRWMTINMWYPWEADESKSFWIIPNANTSSGKIRNNVSDCITFDDLHTLNRQIKVCEKLFHCTQFSVTDIAKKITKLYSLPEHVSLIYQYFLELLLVSLLVLSVRSKHRRPSLRGLGQNDYYLVRQRREQFHTSTVCCYVINPLINSFSHVSQLSKSLRLLSLNIMINSNTNNKHNKKQPRRKPRIVGGQVVTNPEQRFPYFALYSGSHMCGKYNLLSRN